MLNYIDMFPLLTAIILIAGVLAAVFIKPHKFKDSRIAVLLSTMGGMAVVILSLNVVLTTIGLEKQHNVIKAQFTKKTIDKLWLFPNQILKDAKHARPEFIGSLYYNNPDLYKITHNTETPQNFQSEIEEQYIAFVLIKAWEDYLTLKNFDQTGDAVWLYKFIQWAQSPYLKAIYETMKYNHSQSTIDFADLLFEYAAKIPKPSNNPTFYKETVEKLLKDQRLQKIFKETGH